MLILLYIYINYINECFIVYQVFKLFNLWIMVIMNVLVELYQEFDFKFNLKFEIEVLCKILNIDLGVSIYFLFVEIFNFEIYKIMRFVFCMYI